MPTPNEYPATVECPQCGHEVETTLYVYQDGSGAYVFGSTARSAMRPWRWT